MEQLRRSSLQEVHMQRHPVNSSMHSLPSDNQVMQCWLKYYRYKQYRVAQSKPDYFFLLSKFCISTTKHVNMIIYMYHPKH